MNRKRCDLDQVYGPSAWWWEVEELVRKLFLSAVVVLIESGSPLQVRVLFYHSIQLTGTHTVICRHTPADTGTHAGAHADTHRHTDTDTTAQNVHTPQWHTVVRTCILLC